MVSFDTTARQMTEMSQEKTDRNVSAKKKQEWFKPNYKPKARSSLHIFIKFIEIPKMLST